MKSFFFCILLKGHWPSLLPIFFVAFSISIEIQIHHLNPNSIAHVAIFVHLCEAFLGIEPNFALF
jgi:uncharacterized membrane protein YjjP (DUF1212 family)